MLTQRTRRRGRRPFTALASRLKLGTRCGNSKGTICYSSYGVTLLFPRVNNYDEEGLWCVQYRSYARIQHVSVLYTTCIVRTAQSSLFVTW